MTESDNTSKPYEFSQLEDLLTSPSLGEKNTNIVFQYTDKDTLREVVREYKLHLKGDEDKNKIPLDSYINGIGIENNDEKIMFAVCNLYRLWNKSPYWLQKKNGKTLYVFGISYSEKLKSFIIGGYLENKKGENRFVAFQWKQPVNTIALLADAIILDHVPDGIRLKKETALYRLFHIACVKNFANY